MWSKFTETAQEAIYFAQVEAEQCAASRIRPEHILLSIMRQSDSSATKVLTILGIDISCLAATLRRLLPSGPASDVRIKYLLDEDTQQMINLCYSAARSLNCNYIGTEHILLSLTSRSEGLAGQVLNQAGAGHDRVLETVVWLREAAQASGDPPLETIASPRADMKPEEHSVEDAERPLSESLWGQFSAEGRRVIILAQEECGRLGEQGLTDKHLLLGLIRLEEMAVIRDLEGCGLDLDKLNAAVERYPAAPAVPNRALALSTGARRALDCAIEEAANEGTVANPKELLLGLLLSMAPITQVFSSLEVDPDRLVVELRTSAPPAVEEANIDDQNAQHASAAHASGEAGCQARLGPLYILLLLIGECLLRPPAIQLAYVTMSLFFLGPLMSSSNEYAGDMNLDVGNWLSSGISQWHWKGAIFHLSLAAKNYRAARFGQKSGSHVRGLLLAKEARAHLLTEMIRLNHVKAWRQETQIRLQTVLKMAQDARCYLEQFEEAHGRALLTEATALGLLGTACGQEPVENLNAACLLFEQAQQQLDRKAVVNDRFDMDYDLAIRLYGVAAAALGGLGIDEHQNLEKAEAALQRAAARLSPGSTDLVRVQMVLIEVYRKKAELGVTRPSNIQQAIALCRQIQETTSKHIDVYYDAMEQEADLLFDLSEADINPESNLLLALNVYDQLQRKTVARGGILIKKAVVLKAQITRNFVPLSEARTAYALLDEEKQRYETSSFVWGLLRCFQGEFLRLLKQDNDAYDHFKEGLEAVEAMRGQMRREQERVAFSEKLGFFSADMVATCLDLADAAATPEAQEHWRWEGWHWTYRVKSRALLELLSSNRPRAHPEQRPLWDELNQLSKALDDQQREIQRLRQILDAEAGTDPASRASHTGHRLDRLSRLYEGAHDEYNRKRREAIRSAEGAEPLPTVPGPLPSAVAAAARALAGDTGRALLIDFCQTAPKEITIFLLPLWEQAPPTVVRRELAERELQEAIEHWSELIPSVSGEAHSGAQQGSRKPRKDQAALLSHMGRLFEPLTPYLEKWQPDTLVLSPQGVLSLLPLHATFWQGKPLIERFEVAYLPSAALSQEVSKRSKPSATSALLLGNPTQDLAASEEEVIAIGRQITAGGFDVQVFLREEATTRSVSASIGGAGIIHFAGHSVLEGADFLRSGIELADRRLTVLDITSHIVLEQACLVYLSSCNSALAVSGRTDELMALARAFLYAGSPTVIATLWEVDDDASSLFASTFYRFWIGEKASLGAAFRQATRETRDVYPNPRMWAGFVLIGAWKTTAAG